MVPRLYSARGLAAQDALDVIAAGREVHAGNFLIRDRRTYRVKQWYPTERLEELAAFAAIIVAEGRDIIDGTSQFVIAGVASDGTRLPVERIPTHRFELMKWVLVRWGARAIVSTGKNRQLAEAILRLSHALEAAPRAANREWADA